MASLAERSASPWTATSIRDRPAGCSTCASSLCGAVCGNGRSPAADVDGLLVPIDRRRFGAAPAMMVPRRRGATNTTLAATQRHPCRAGMVTAGCARSRLRPESVWRLAALKDQQKIPAVRHWRALGELERIGFGTDANKLVAEIHDRMPLIPAPGDYARWLADEPDPHELMRPLGLAASLDRAHQISLANCRCHRTNNEKTNT